MKFIPTQKPLKPRKALVTVLRITRVNATDDSDTFKLEGRVAGLWVDELTRLVRVRNDGRRLVLDVTDVSFADDAGVRLLRDLAEHNAELRGASMFLTGLMEGDRNDCRG